MLFHSDVLKRIDGRTVRRLFWVLAGLLLLNPAAFGGTLEDITFNTLAGDRIQIQMHIAGDAPEPRSFSIDNPARIALDLAGTSLGMADSTVKVGVGITRSIRAVEAGGRTRVVINLTRVAPYEVTTENGLVLVNVDGGAQAVESSGTGGTVGAVAEVAEADTEASNALTEVDFRRGPDGEGRVIVELGSAETSVDMRDAGDEIIVDFLDTALPERLERRLDVMDFATRVNTIDTVTRDRAVRMTVAATSPFEHFAYQTDKTFVIEVRPVAEEETEARRAAEKEYTGDKLSLNFQNIEVRAVLQLLADFTGLNMVTSDTVQGSLTLRLKNVPWDQALDIILKTKGLDMRRRGDVIMVAPTEEIAAREKLELEARKQLEELAPLYSETIQVNYAKAQDLADLLKSEENSLLSERGSITIDERTNKLLVKDTSDNLDAIRRLVQELDVPVRQVLIESRIVVADDTFGRDLGVRFGATAITEGQAGSVIGTTGSAQGTAGMIDDAGTNVSNSGQPYPVDTPNLDDRLNVNLPVSNPAGQFALAILGADYLVDLELSAMQQEGRGEVISSPRVLTSNQKEAVIERGEEIPYLQASSSGATNVAFKKAVLSLSVTPQITPDDRVIMDLLVTKDTRGVETAGVPSINTRKVTTQVLVNNGDTVVLGGIFEREKRDEVDKVPGFGDLPIVGHLFRQTRRLDDKRELLIFVTPKILKEVDQSGF